MTPGQDLSVAGLASVLADFCDALGLDGIDLVANDTGGAIAQVFAARHPQRLATFTLTNCDVSDNLPPDAFQPIVELAAAGSLAPTSLALLDDLDTAVQVAFGTAYEHPQRADREVVRSYLEPCFGTLERGREFERLLVALDPGDLRAVEPQLRELTVPTLVVWGTGDENFDVSWAYWLRDTIPGVTRVVTVDGARVFFPEERPMDLVPHLEQHWTEAPRSGCDRQPVRPYVLLPRPVGGAGGPLTTAACPMSRSPGRPLAVSGDVPLRRLPEPAVTLARSRRRRGCPRRAGSRPASPPGRGTGRSACPR